MLLNIKFNYLSEGAMMPPEIYFQRKDNIKSIRRTICVCLCRYHYVLKTCQLLPILFQELNDFYLGISFIQFTTKHTNNNLCTQHKTQNIKRISQLLL